VDDEKRLCRSLEILLREEGPFNVAIASDYYSALEKLREPVDLVLTDLTMPGKSGLDLLRAVKAERPAMPVVLMTAYSTVESAVEAMKDGAVDYIVKPFENEKLVALLRRALKGRSVGEEPEAEAPALERFGDLIGQSPAMQKVYDLIQRAAEADATVLITGESGTGKELVARAIHYSGARKAKPFVALNCSAVPETLLESEMFGHERGAFSGAVRSHEGRFELADQGTLFLDEIGEMSPLLQVKLLRVLQEKEFLRVGGTRTIRVDVRIIAATNRDLPRAVKDGTFREDLYYRLNVVGVHLPPLRERPEDLPVLLEHFLTEKCRKNGLARKSLSEGARSALLAYGYPGNVRELENLIERACVMSRGPAIEEADLPIDRPSATADPGAAIAIESGLKNLNEMHGRLERELVERAIRAHPGKSNSELAEILGTSRRVLESRLRLYDIKKP
jgi:DNA-binding NtrC family response regulator